MLQKQVKDQVKQRLDTASSAGNFCFRCQSGIRPPPPPPSGSPELPAEEAGLDSRSKTCNASARHKLASTIDVTMPLRDKSLSQAIPCNCTFSMWFFVCHCYIFVVFNLASEYIAEKMLLLGIFLTEGVPVSILFIFSLMWNAVPGNMVYLLILYTFCGLSTLPYILCCSLLSKITSQKHASFYPSLALAITSLAAISVRCISGLIFTKEVMEIYSCVCVLVWLFSFLWLCFEHRGLPDYHFEH